MNDTFDLRRLGFLIRGDAIGRYRPLLIVSAALAGAILISTLYVKPMIAPSASLYLPWFVGMLLIWGTILASRAFKELHDKTRNDAYLLLPASALEKTVGRLLLVTVFFVAYLLIFTTVVSWLTEAVNELVYGRSNPVFQPFDSRVWTLIGRYLALQSLFFLGAAWFRKNHFIKTASTIVAGVIGFSVLAYLIARIVLAPYFVDGSFILRGVDGYDFYLENQVFFDAAGRIIDIVSFIVLPLFCWTVAWLRVKETQTSYGV